MAKIKWETPYRGIKTKNHETRKHGIKPDKYYTIRFQFNKKRIESCLGWASDGWTLEKAIVRMQELKEEAKKGEGVKTHRKKMIEVDEQRKKLEVKEQRRLKQELKNSMTIGKYFEEIYYPAIQQEKKRKTYISEEQQFRIWIQPVIGKKPFKDISSFDLEKLKKRIFDSGKAPRTVEYCLTTLGQVFRYAVKTGHHTGEILTKQVRKPKFDNKRVRFLSLDEAHQLLETLNGMSRQVYEMALVSLHCGLRAGELFSLTKADIDLEYGLITLKNTKSGKTRVLSMTGDVKRLLLPKKIGKRSEFVFPAKNGKKIVNMSQTFPRAVKKVGLNDGITDRRQRVTFHTLRHTFASWLVMEGISLYEDKELLGHASLTMTERYSHLAPDRNKRVAKTLGNLFQKTKTEFTKASLK